MNRITCRRKHANEDKQEEEADGGRESENAYKGDEREAGGDREENWKQEVEGNACEPKVDTYQSCVEDVGGEHDMHCKQDKKAYAFVKVRDMAQECEEDTERARHVEKLISFQFQDPEAHHGPGTCPITGLRYIIIKKREKEVENDRTKKEESPPPKKGQLGIE
ncbi:hypothetical protein NDU88_006421 [Pleurodeles waltl]|uniref:Uncharacterized protein n=1 Tax=Pleurodeles waltl TaxID=8319 RepID=A0AAV7TDX5_PLEWA|nr:hypothetical protein NDU88_006421 [Pleurodeles waltl]